MFLYQSRWIFLVVFIAQASSETGITCSPKMTGIKLTYW